MEKKSERGGDLMTKEIDSDSNEGPCIAFHNIRGKRTLTASWRISFRFFSPPLKPSFTFLDKKLASIFSWSSFGVKKA